MKKKQPKFNSKTRTLVEKYPYPKKLLVISFILTLTGFALLTGLTFILASEVPWEKYAKEKAIYAQSMQEVVHYIFVIGITILILLGYIWKLTANTLRKWHGEIIRLTQMHDANVHERANEDQSRTTLLSTTKMIALGEMAGGIAHEINTPLAVIAVRSQHLEKALKSQPPNIEIALAYATAIRSAAERISIIIRGLRLFSRNGENDAIETCRMFEVINSTLDLCSEKFKSGQIALIVDLSDNDLTFEGRPFQISQVLLSLLNNSYDAIIGLEERWVRIDCKRKSDTIYIKVTDSGLGIPSEIAEKIMDPFFTTKAIGEGTGLGLSIARGIIEEHGGSISLDRTCPNTSFVIKLSKYHALRKKTSPAA
jgi:C4-dicarboxylate-specific signal transduction histidine kinase